MSDFKLTRIALSLCVVLAISHACLGQRAKRAKARARTAKPPAEIVVSAPDPGGYSKSVGQAEVTYLPGLGVTTAHVHFEEVYRRAKLRLSMTAQISVRGDRIVNPESVTLHIFYPQHEPSFAEPPELSVETDGEWQSFGVTAHAETELINFATGAVSKAVGKDVDLQTFGRIAAAKRVRMRVGKIEFALSPKQSAALRDLLKTIEP